MSIRSISIFKDPNVAEHLSPLHDKYVFTTDKAHNNIVLVCKLHYIDCLITELRYWQFTWQPHIYPDDTHERGNPEQSGLLYVPLEFQPKMKNWIYHHSTGFLNNRFDNYFTYFVPVFKYCYSDSRNLWTVMRAGGLAP
jgi:hypothetical protein